MGVFLFECYFSPFVPSEITKVILYRGIKYAIKRVMMKKRLGTVPKGLEWISAAQEEHDMPISKQHIDHLIPAAKRGLQEDLIRATFILKQDYLEKIKAYAYWERLQIKDVFDDMCEQYFKDKKVRSVPDRRK